MKSFIILFSFFLSHFYVNAQKSEVDTSEILGLINAHYDDRYNKPDYGLLIADSIVTLSKRLNYLRGFAEAYGMKAECFWIKGDYANSMYYILMTIDLYKRLKDEANVVLNNSFLGTLYFELGDARRAINIGLDARKFLLSCSDTIDLTIYRFPRDAVLHNNDIDLAQAYSQANLMDSASYFIQRALNWERRQKSNSSYATYVAGDIYAKMGMDSVALTVYNRPNTQGARNDFIDINIGKATVFQMINQNDSCKYYAKKALDTAQLIGYTKAVMRAADLLSSLYEQNNTTEYIRYLKIANTAKDSLYSAEKINLLNSFLLNNELRQRDADEVETKFNYQKKIFLLIAVSGLFLVTGGLLWRNNQHKKKSNMLLQSEKQKVEETLEGLKSTQTQLIQSEKMASLGELTAGIAHEIQNPLNFVNNFSDVNTELIDELQNEADKGNMDEVKAIANDIKENEQKINHHGKRAGDIVKGMLQHSRSSTGVKEPTDINALADEFFRLSYQGLRAKDKSFNATMRTDFDESIGKINIIPQDIGRVLLNLYNNAFYAVKERHASTSSAGQSYEPTVSVTTKKSENQVIITVSDNGNGIPQKIVDKIFQPFFTTKPTGQGTGLGLSLSYDIVKAHGGEIKVETKEEEAYPDDPVGQGSEFIIQLPVK